MWSCNSGGGDVWWRCCECGGGRLGEICVLVVVMVFGGSGDADGVGDTSVVVLQME